MYKASPPPGSRGHNRSVYALHDVTFLVATNPLLPSPGKGRNWIAVNGSLPLQGRVREGLWQPPVKFVFFDGVERHDVIPIIL